MLYYVKSETENAIITSSYVSEKQARRYGGDPVSAHLYLMDDGFSAKIIDYHPDQDGEELVPIGLVRTIFESKVDGAKSGNFLLYMKDEDGDWYYTGIFFASMSDANQAVKGPLSGTYGDMMILETKEVTPTSKEEAKIL